MKACLFPGQGSQFLSMGAAQFDRFPELVDAADEILGYSIRRLCLQDPLSRLNNTAFTQPALFVVNYLMYLEYLEQHGAPEFLMGHSLGEYDALAAGGILTFGDALRLVKRRGELMAQAKQGGMLALLGLTSEEVRGRIEEFDLSEIDIANQNAPDQIILAGPQGDLKEAARRFGDVEGCRCIPLNVSGAFHSRLMAPARKEFDAALGSVCFLPGSVEVMSNYTARPYRQGDPRELLSAQIVSPVRWVDSMRYLMARGVDGFVQVGPGSVIDGLTRKIVGVCQPLSIEDLAAEEELAPQPQAVPSGQAAPAEPGRQVDVSARRHVSADTLGAQAFRDTFGVDRAIVAGGMYKGISSPELVVAMGRAGLLAVYGASGLGLDEIRAGVRSIRAALDRGQSFAVNYISSPASPDREEAFVDLLLEEQVGLVEASAFMSLTREIVRYRATGLSRGAHGGIERAHRIMAKLSHPEVARQFAQPPKQRMVDELVAARAITAEQAELIMRVPMADAITVEGNSGGHTDGGTLDVTFPTIRRQVRRAERESCGTIDIVMGAAGGLGSPEAVAAAFVLGAGYVVTGSINQCTPEAGTSDAVKDILATVDTQDTKLCATGDMFELGSKIQVVRKGLFFPARANRLYELYRQYESLQDIPVDVMSQLEDKYFKRPLSQVREGVLAQLNEENRRRCETSPQAMMVAIMKWYFMATTQAALTGDEAWRLDYQIHCGPSMGAFNEWVKGTELEEWRSRRVATINTRLLTAAADLLSDVPRLVVH